MAKRHKAVLCETRYKGQRTCVKRQTETHPIPCPRCEGYRAGWIVGGKTYYKSPVDRLFVGWTPRNGIQVPIFTDGNRPKL